MIGSEIEARIAAYQRTDDLFQANLYRELLACYNSVVRKGLKDSPISVEIPEFGLTRTSTCDLPVIEDEFLSKLARKVNAVAGRFGDKLPLVCLSTLGSAPHDQPDWEALRNGLNQQEKLALMRPINHITRYLGRERVTVGDIRHMGLEELAAVNRVGKRSALLIKTCLNGLPQEVPA